MFVRDTYGALYHSVDDGSEDVRIARVLNAKHANSVHSGDSGAYYIIAKGVVSDRGWAC